MTWQRVGPDEWGRFGNPNEAWYPVKWVPDEPEYVPDLSNPRVALPWVDTSYDFFASPSELSQGIYAQHGADCWVRTRSPRWVSERR